MIEFHEATAADLEEVAKTSISHGIKDQPGRTDYVYALKEDDVTLGVGGFKLLTPNTAWVWLDWAEAALSRRTLVYRVTKEFMSKFAGMMELDLIMAAVRPDFEEAVRTVEHLGFKKECQLPQFFGDSPADLYVLELGKERD